MLRYSEIIKNGAEDSGDHKKKNYSVRFSGGETLGTTPESKVMPAQVDLEYMKILHATILSRMKDIQSLITNGEDFGIKEPLDIVRHITSTADSIEKFYQSTALDSRTGGDRDYLVNHMIDVMTYAVKIGKGLDYSKEELTELGLAALFYDVGFFRISETITGKREKLEESELYSIKKHAENGGNILSRFKAEHPMMLRVAREHHEREDGTGYPGELRGSEICEYAKIVGLCDAYDAMINDRPYRKALAQHFSVKELVRGRKSAFSLKIIKAFLDELSIFPVGCYVKLNNSTIGRVIATNREHPLRPTIKLVVNSSGNRETVERIINIDENPVLHVSAAVSNEELSTYGITG